MNDNRLLLYIRLIVDRLINLGGADYNSDEATSPKDKSKGLIARDFSTEEWDQPQGVGLYGLLKLQDFYKDGRYLEFLRNWYDSNLKKELPSRNINTTVPCLTLAYLLDVLDNPEYEELCIRQTWWLMTEIPRIPEGDFRHVTSAIDGRNGAVSNDGGLWINTLSMAILFLSEIDQRCGEKGWASESVHQVLLHIKYLYEKRNDLFYHGFSLPLDSNFGDTLWCRGNSWLIVGIMDCSETFQGSLDMGFPVYLVNTYKTQMQALKGPQPPSGLWHAVLADPTSYEEVSGSVAITTGILKGLKSGVLDETYRPCVQNAVEAICRNISEDDAVEDVSAGAGIECDTQHYGDTVIMPMTYGQFSALLALYEVLT